MKMIIITLFMFLSISAMAVTKAEVLEAEKDANYKSIQAARFILIAHELELMSDNPAVIESAKMRATDAMRTALTANDKLKRLKALEKKQSKNTKSRSSLCGHIASRRCVGKRKRQNVCFREKSILFLSYSLYS